GGAHGALQATPAGPTGGTTAFASNQALVGSPWARHGAVDQGSVRFVLSLGCDERADLSPLLASLLPVPMGRRIRACVPVSAHPRGVGQSQACRAKRHGVRAASL